MIYIFIMIEYKVHLDRESAIPNFGLAILCNWLHIIDSLVKNFLRYKIKGSGNMISQVHSWSNILAISLLELVFYPIFYTTQLVYTTD